MAGGRSLQPCVVLAEAVSMWGQGQGEAVPAHVLFIKSPRLLRKFKGKQGTIYSNKQEQKNQEKTYSSEV